MWKKSNMGFPDLCSSLPATPEKGQNDLWATVENVRNGHGAYGYNARHDRYEDLLAGGIIDPTKVTRSALQHSASVAGLLLTTEALIADAEEEEGEH